MELDDQLAALAAGELGDDEARALRARVAADPALARRLARHERLQQLLVAWDAPPMSDAAVQRLEGRLDEALAALDDTPLTARAAPSAALPALGEASRGDASAGGVVDFDDARRRRDRDSDGRTIGWGTWGAGAAVAAALVAVVGTGVVLGGLAGSSDDAMLAEDTAEESTDSAEAGEDEALANDLADADAPTDESAAAEEFARLGPGWLSNVDVAEGDLPPLVELDSSTQASSDGTDDAGATESDAGADEPAAAAATDGCVTEALERDTAQAEGRELWLLATGTYAGQDATFVVLRTPDGVSGDRFEALAYDPVDCSLLARDETSR